MSLLSIIATSTFISFMSDGRVFDHENDEVVDESFKKIFKVNNKIIYAVGGNYAVAKILEQEIGNFDLTNAKRFAHSLFNVLGCGKVHKEMHIFIGGIDDNNKIYYAGFSQDSTKLNEINPPRGSNNYACNETGVNENIIYHDIFGELMSRNARLLKVKDAKLIQEKFKAQISMIDKTVNTRTFHEYIKI
ncbi:MAG: hypothetical protein ABS960_00710 [Solibacillus isronensis]